MNAETSSVVATLSAHILTRTINSGTLLSEAAIQKEFGITRQAAHAIIMELIDRGLMTNRGRYLVDTVSANETYPILNVIWALELTAISIINRNQWLDLSPLNPQATYAVACGLGNEAKFGHELIRVANMTIAIAHHRRCWNRLYLGNCKLAEANPATFACELEEVVVALTEKKTADARAAYNRYFEKLLAICGFSQQQSLVADFQTPFMHAVSSS